MLSKEQVLEIIAYCDNHGVQHKERLREQGITEWNFYRSRRQYLRQGICLRDDALTPE